MGFFNTIIDLLSPSSSLSDREIELTVYKIGYICRTSPLIKSIRYRKKYAILCCFCCIRDTEYNQKTGFFIGFYSKNKHMTTVLPSLLSTGVLLTSRPKHLKKANFLPICAHVCPYLCRFLHMFFAVSCCFSYQIAGSPPYGYSVCCNFFVYLITQQNL